MSVEIEGYSTKISEWQLSPLAFVLEAIGGSPTNQQEDALCVLGKLVAAKLKRSCGASMTSDERELSEKLGIAIRSGHGTGKDTFLAWVFIWLLVCFPPPVKGLVTGPDATQLATALWPEVRLWLRKSTLELWKSIEVIKGQIRPIDRGGEAFVEARTVRKESNEDQQGEALGGIHAPFMVYAVDEASGIPRAVFGPLEGGMTGEMNIAILIGNPLRGSGYFFDCFHEMRKWWIPMHWDAQKSNIDAVTNSNAMAMAIAIRKQKYDANSNFFRTRVTGEFPVAEPDALIPLEDIENAVLREIEIVSGWPIHLGVDVAWRGDDKSVICPRQGCYVHPLRKFQKLDTVDVASWVSIAMTELEPRGVFIDTIGYGAGVYDNLIRNLQRQGVWSVNVSEKTSDSEKFFRKRDELYWTVREKFEQGLISIPDDEELKGELSILKWKPVDGKVKVATKMELRAKHGSSPNCADALMLSFYLDDGATATMKRDKWDAAEERERRRSIRRRSWMSA